MDTKQIVAILAVIALAAAGIGAAYAYQATLVNESNTVESNFLALDTTGEFKDTFTTAESIKYNSKTTKTTSADTSAPNDVLYTPLIVSGTTETVPTESVEFWSGDSRVSAIGVKINSTPYEIRINSSMMEGGNFYTFAVSAFEEGTQNAVDLQKAYVMEYYYQQGQADEVHDAMLLTNAAQYDLFQSDVMNDNKTVKITLWAIQFTGTVASVAPGYEDVDFQFKAYVPATPVVTADLATLTVTTKTHDGNALTVDDVMVYSDANVRQILQTVEHASGSNSYVYKLPAGTYKAQAEKEGGYVFVPDAASVAITKDSSGAIVLTEGATAIRLMDSQDTPVEITALDYTSIATTYTDTVAKLEVTYHTGEVKTYAIDSLPTGATLVNDSDTSITFGKAGTYAVTYAYTENTVALKAAIALTVYTASDLSLAATFSTTNTIADWTAANVTIKATYGAAGTVDGNVFASCTSNADTAINWGTAGNYSVRLVYTDSQGNVFEDTCPVTIS